LSLYLKLDVIKKRISFTEKNKVDISFKILSSDLLKEFKDYVDFKPIQKLDKKDKEEIPFDYFKFYRSISSVYSSKIEGEEVEMDSYMKHKFLNIQYEPDYTKKADDLFKAYEFMESEPLNEVNVLEVHKILSQNLLAKGQRGKIRTKPMFVLNEDDRIEYVACEPSKVKSEWQKLFIDIEFLKKSDLSTLEAFFFAAQIHLVFLKIHPLQDGNGRTARLIEKWFLREKFGTKSTSIELEKNYYLNKAKYYNNIRAIGLEYDYLDYSKSLNFLLMTVLSLK